MTATQAMTFRTGDTPTPDIVILTHSLTREYQRRTSSSRLWDPRGPANRR